MNDTIYKKSFGLFLKRTDEKSVIEKFIRDNIPIHEESDFLDIGGGDGSLALVISKQVKTTLVVEPNQSFFKQLLKHKKIKVVNEKWENARLNNTFDFILAAYVVTYFPQIKRRRLIKKMYDLLRPGGHILILSVDAKSGSWRKIHTYFYKLIGYDHKSSDDILKQIARESKAISKSFKTHIVAKDASEMLDILGFDFYKYPEDFLKFSGHLIKFLKKYSDKDGKVVLEIVHNAHIITKK
ncbi:MAG: class I SAM-dependent methyltransferase [Patescibacteria group bacterium]